ncbi:hypothetical protein NHJ13734_008538 [Beauveria thailandica]
MPAWLQNVEHTLVTSSNATPVVGLLGNGRAHMAHGGPKVSIRELTGKGDNMTVHLRERVFCLSGNPYPATRIL